MSSTITIEFPASLAAILRDEALGTLAVSGDAIEHGAESAHGSPVHGDPDPAAAEEVRQAVKDAVIYVGILDQLGWDDDDTPRTTFTAPAKAVLRLVNSAIQWAVMADRADVDALREALARVEALERVRAQAEVVTA